MSFPSVDVFQFTAVRPATRKPGPPDRRHFIVDDFYYLAKHPNGPGNDSSALLRARVPNGQVSEGLNESDLFSSAALSPIGKLVYEATQSALSRSAQGSARSTLRTRNQLALASVTPRVFALLSSGFIYGPKNDGHRTLPLVRDIPLRSGLSALEGSQLSASSACFAYVRSNVMHVLPSTVDDLPVPLARQLLPLSNLLGDLAQAWASRALGEKLDRERLHRQVRSALGLTGNATIADLVFAPDGSGYEGAFALSRRIAFDLLYSLYVLRRTLPLSLDTALQALRAMNFAEVAAIDEFLFGLTNRRAANTSEQGRLDLLAAAYPGLRQWTPNASDAAKSLLATGAPLLATLGDALRLASASPMVHPLFARLCGAFQPFNEVTPIGVGDLKVVKQTFLGYEKGEIAHIETVLAGEEKSRTHRRLEKSESSFSYSSSSDTEWSKDSQSTSRFELKAEAERVIQLTLGANASTSMTFKGGPVLDSATIGAGLSVSLNDNKTQRSSQNFVREVMEKATTSIQSRVATQRNQTVLFETEETATHKFINPADNGNISGIYRWLDKVYEGQVHNFGRRFMFEFIVPEPAAFYVETRLEAHSRSLNLPRKPVKGSVGTTAQPVLPVKQPSDITDTKFRELAGTYELSRFSFPAETMDKTIKNSLTQDSNFLMQNPSAWGDSSPLRDEAFTGDLGDVPPGYVVDLFTATGTAKFINKSDTNPDEINTLQVFANSRLVFERVDERSENWTNVASGNGVKAISLANANLSVSSTLPIRIATKTCTSHILNFNVRLKRTPAALAQWQREVYDEVARQAASKSQASGGAEDYDSQLARYQAAIDDLRDVNLNDLLQGRSGAANAELVRTELRRQCISEIAREYDADSSDDVVSKLDALDRFAVGDVMYRQLVVGPAPKGRGKADSDLASFQDTPDGATSSYSAVNVDIARRKGRYVQFLEQAFEWDQLSFLLYPYFWAHPPRWIEMLAREDQADPQFTRFLQAGSARVLLAVKPGYEDAVLHFLATGEPWEGGVPPVIGDPTFIPLYEEVKAQQDNWAGSEPDGAPWIFRLPTSLLYLENEEKYPLTNEYRPTPPTP